ncbi:MAG: hypothetical protein JST10_02790 [Bacteroidetes bacterium]|nr:hypothetical protein [Bacteroidota bacterium]
MNYTEKYLTPCVFFDDKTFEEYCAQIPLYYFKEGIPEDVLKSFEVVTSLLAYSYYNYLLIDEAYSKALRVFEMAMKIRLLELGENAEKWTFHTLSQRLLKLNMFDSDDALLAYAKSARNHFSHPKHHSFAGAIYWDRISIVPRLINELYEDVNLRAERKACMREFGDLLTDNALGSEIILELDEEVHSLYSLHLLFINNKVSPHTYQLCAVPLFDLTQVGNEIIVPRAFEVVVVNPKFTNGYLEAFEAGTNQKLTVFSIRKMPKPVSNYLKWKAMFDGKPDFVRFLYTQAIGKSVSEFYRPAMDVFQKL